MKKLLAIVAILFFVGCGYKPASHYTKTVLGEKVFADVKIGIDDPQSGIVSLDALNEAIVAKFGARLVSRSEADSTITITAATQSFGVLQRDRNGFVILYRSQVAMNAVVSSAKIKNGAFSVSGFYDFAVNPTKSVLSDADKNFAAKEAALKALDELIVQVVLLGK